MRVDWSKAWRKTKEFVVAQFLLISFLLALTVALAWPAPGKAVGSVTIVGDVRLIQQINIMIVFFISGLVLKTDDLRAAARHKLGVAYGFLAVNGLTPLLGFGFRDVPLDPLAFAAGLTVMCAVPTTLGIGISLVRSCKGNEGLALLLTVGTNLAGIISMPLYLKALFSGTSLEVNVDIPDLLVKLIIAVLVPSVVGKVLRELFKPVQEFTKRYKTALGLFSTANLAFIVWQVLSGARDDLIHQQFVQILYVALLAIGQHIAYLLFNFAVVWYLLRMPPPEAIASGIMSSQKSAPVAYTAISYLTSDATQQGLMAIPALVSQLAQVFIGSALVPFFAKKVTQWRREQETLAPMTSAPAAAAGDSKGAQEGVQPGPASQAEANEKSAHGSEGSLGKELKVGPDEEEGGCPDRP